MTAALSEPLVRFIDVRKSYDGKVDAVRALNLDVANGEFLTLLGPSGSGKTTTLTMLAGFEQPSAGRIFLGGDDITHVPVEKRGIGMVFQNYALFPTHDGGREHRLSAQGPAHGRRGDRAEGQARARHGAARRPAPTASRSSFPAASSSGSRWRARWSSSRELVLLDEPLGALDRQLREQMQYEVKHLHERLGVTMVYVTHDQVEAMTMSDRVAVFSAGQLRQIAAPRRLYEEPESLFVAQFLGESNILAGTVRHRHGGQCSVALGTGQGVVATAVTASEKVNLAIRPEKVALGAPRPGASIAFPPTCSRSPSSATSCACGWRRWAARISS